MEDKLIESYNGRLRDEGMNVKKSRGLGEARRRLEAWRIDYDTLRPSDSLGQLTRAVSSEGVGHPGCREPRSTIFCPDWEGFRPYMRGYIR